MENFLHLIAHHGIVIRFNQMRKEAEVDIPGLDASPQNRENVTATYLESLMIKYGMSPASVGRYILAAADRDSYDPFADWINSKPWDGVNRLADICNTITPADEYPAAFGCQMIVKWLLSIVAVTFYGPGFHCRGILTFQGGQGKARARPAGSPGWSLRSSSAMKRSNSVTAGMAAARTPAFRQSASHRRVGRTGRIAKA
jgi:putative DNA primase/helicase